jgi:glycerol-3-phosphate dehydrogenase
LPSTRSGSCAPSFRKCRPRGPIANRCREAVASAGHGIRARACRAGGNFLRTCSPRWLTQRTTPRVLGDARGPADLGAHFGHTLYAAEIDYLVAQEWATEADDVLWRRTKCGLHLRAEERDVVAAYLRELRTRGGGSA